MYAEFIDYHNLEVWKDCHINIYNSMYYYSQIKVNNILGSIGIL